MIGQSQEPHLAIGRTFKESLQKCLRSLEIGRSGLGGDGKPWRIGTEVYGDRESLRGKLNVPTHHITPPFPK